MTDFQAHAEELIKEYREKRAQVISKRRKLRSASEDERQRKLANYEKGLKYISDELEKALKTYIEVFNHSLPQLVCSIQKRSIYPDDLDIVLSLKNHSFRFVSRAANQGEEMHGILVDGMLYCESTYKGGDRRLEARAGLFGDIAHDAWCSIDDEGKFVHFLNDILPELIRSIWNSATLSFVHSQDECVTGDGSL